jgi:hypothetical protein
MLRHTADWAYGNAQVRGIAFELIAGSELVLWSLVSSVAANAVVVEVDLLQSRPLPVVDWQGYSGLEAS